MDKAQVLVVEDEAIVAIDLQYKLEALGYCVPSVTRSGEEAVASAAELNPALVLMDIKLDGDVDGIDAARQIRDRLDVPVVYLTAHADETTLQRAKMTEPFGYLFKPVDQRALQTVVEITIHKHRVERKLKESERWLAAVLRSTSDAIVTADATGCVTFMNPVAEALMGWSKEDALGKDLAALFDVTGGRGRKSAENPVTQAFRESVAVHLADDAALVSRSGGAISLGGTAAPMWDDAGKVTGVVLTFRDVSERKLAERDLAAALEKARETDRLKSQLLSTVSHELHTPLAAIKGFATTLLDNEDKLEYGERREFLQEIDAASDRLTSLIAHLLDFSRMEAGLLPIAQVLTDVNEVLAGVLSHWRIRAPERPVAVVVPQALPKVMADPRRLRQVLDNLLENAHKYTPAHCQVSIECVEAVNDGKPMVQLTVRDEGPGIPAEQLERIFEPFQQADEAGRQAGGVGLGLAICRRIVDAQQGRIWAESSIGQGAAFVMTLPVADRKRRRVRRE
jgi:PAS domain S-box-containing protein